MRRIVQTASLIALTICGLLLTLMMIGGKSLTINAQSTNPTATLPPNVIIVTQPPPPTATPRPTYIGGAADHLLGTDSAYLTVVLYGDFQSTPSFDVARILAVLRDRYLEDMRIVWRHFPQPTNDKSMLAAQASEAASAQGKFWEMHDQLFTHQSEWASLPPDQFRTKLVDYAKIVGIIDLSAFNTALDQQTYVPLIQKAVQEAADLDLKGVPVLLFNGLPYSGRIDEFALDTFTRLKLLEKRWYAHQPELIINLEKKYTATLNTEKGNVVIELYAKAAPVTVNNFVFLAQDGWYNNITFHRVIPGQLVQTGDPSGSGFGTAGYHIISEADNGLIFDREGLVAMASQKDMPDTASAQFFITLGPLRPSLDYDKQYAIFGTVKEGMDVLRKLTPRDPFDELRFPNPPPGDKLISIQITEGN
jgi:cyclophilin family peptidyl-prolyl cis-trans isomerase/protein-disulfide isomerase